MKERERGLWRVSQNNAEVFASFTELEEFAHKGTAFRYWGKGKFIT